MDGIGWIEVSSAAAAMPIQRVLGNIRPKAQAVTRAVVMAMCVPWFFDGKVLYRADLQC